MNFIDLMGKKLDKMDEQKDPGFGLVVHGCDQI